MTIDPERRQVTIAGRPIELTPTEFDPPEDLPYLFDRFWRADRTRAEGSGLGLAIARELVRAHGGRIWVETAAGQGAAFHFTLPGSLRS